MRLFQDPHAPNPRRVRIFMAEKQLGARGVSVDLVEVSINDQANRAPEHLERHPLGLLPVLELDDGRTLRESMAICRWIAPLGSLEPRGARGRPRWRNVPRRRRSARSGGATRRALG